jgi:hypothetical protein
MAEFDRELLRSGLGTGSCPSVEQLEALLGDTSPSALKQHVESCAACRTELELLRSFTVGEVRESEAAAVSAITARLRPPARAREIVQVKTPWWRELFAQRWFAPAMMATAALLVAIGVAIQIERSKQPALLVPGGGTEVLRSGSIAIVSPSGDVQEKPREIRWEPVANAARYKCAILQVDRTELWSGEAREPRVDLPPSAQTLIVPARTLLIHVEAFDAGGNRIAESEPVRFRLLQSVYDR